MALPLTRNRTYVGSDPLVSADMNDIQDQIIAQQAGARASRTRYLVPFGVFSNATLSRHYASSSASGSIIVPLELQNGERIIGLGFDRYGNAAANMYMRIYKAPMATAVLVEELEVVAPAASWAPSNQTLGTPHVVLLGSMYTIELTMAAASMRIGQLRVVTDVTP